LRAALDYVRQGDVLIVWKLERPVASASAPSPRRLTRRRREGAWVFHLFGALGRFERDLIQERTRAAATRGRKGRP
jgi:DNA invertase Pin-like site-specific DNA recombinase